MDETIVIDHGLDGFEGVTFAPIDEITCFVNPNLPGCDVDPPLD